ncbi:hypothetical protein [Micromonospora zamorensis]|uniref:ATP-binding protein n=1 Tax=Micromonospora zamorensis TaxID=709883 RepID=A0ABZ1PN12_9ACTN
MMLEDLRKLESKWKRVSPRRANGGRHAISGFHYQFRSTLLSTVSRFIEDPGASSESVIAECLSDLRIAKDDAVVTVQIKRRHTNQSVRAALDQLWEIYLLANEFPNLQPRLRFEIQASTSDLGDAKATIDRWINNPERSDCDSVTLRSFARAVQITTVSDPARELHAILHNKLSASNPVALVRRWLARLLESSESEDGFSLAARDIWSELVELGSSRTTRRADIRLWQDEYVQPARIEPGEYLTGQQPRLYHLRDGYFASRPEILDRVKQDFLVWLDSQPAFVDNTVRLPIFWIGGRSGSGKSILLLQLLADLHSGAMARVVWLGNSPSLLARGIEWVEQAERGDPDSHLLSILAIDDPYHTSSAEVTAHWQKAIAIVDDLRHSGEGERLPLLVCCGPTEQAEQLSRDFADDVTVTQSLLEKESAADYEVLGSWFTRRTNTKIVPVSEPNILLVQLFFEWHHKTSLKEFAARLRDRLLAMDSQNKIIAAVTKVLAINRLYSGYPTRAFESALPAEQRDALAKLQEQEHLEIRGQGSRQGVWLTHPHIANLIYDAWFPESASTNTRKNHLLRVISDCNLYGEDPATRTAPLWALSRVLADVTGDLGARVSKDSIAEILLQTYRERIAADTMPLAELPVWLELAAALPTIEWKPHPLPRTLSYINGTKVGADTTGLRLTCHKLLQHYRQSEGAAQAIIDLLEQKADWREWHFVAIDAVKKLRDPRLNSLIEFWAKSTNVSKNIAGDLLSAALKHLPEDEKLVSLSASLLTTAAPTSQWGEVAIRLLERDYTLYRPQAMQWLRAHRLRREVVFVLAHLLHLQTVTGDHDQDILNVARLWLQRHFLEPTANFVLEPLLGLVSPNDEMHRLASGWLTVGAGDQSDVVTVLVSQYGRSDLGLRWLLEASSNHASWPYVWEAVWKAHDRSRELAEIGLAWLDGHHDHSAWPRAWKALWRWNFYREAIGPQGLDWLTRRNYSPEWPGLWRLLWKSGESVPQLSDEGYRWLPNGTSHTLWPHVWEALWKTGRRGDQLQPLALAWIQLNPGHERWPHLWDELRKVDWATSELVELASAWLQSYGLDRHGWHHVWVKLLEEDNFSEPLNAVAWSQLHNFASIREKPISSRWPRVWRSLWAWCPEDRERLSIAAIEWLSVAPINKQWQEVALANLDHGKVVAELHEVAVTRLNELSQDDVNWTTLWRIGWLCDLDRPILRDGAMDWLNSHQERRSWHSVWHTLLKEDRHSQQLFSLGMECIRHQLSHEAWHLIFGALWHIEVQRDELGDLAQRWLSHSCNGDVTSRSVVQNLLAEPRTSGGGLPTRKTYME